MCGVFNDDFMANHVGLVSAHSSRPHSLQSLRVQSSPVSTVFVLAVGAIFTH